MKLFPLRLIPDNTKIDFIKISKYCYILSVFVTLLSFFSFGINKFNFGIDFVGGTIIEVSMNDKVNIHFINDELSQLKLGELIIQDFGQNQLMIKFGSDIKGVDAVSLVKEKLIQIIPSIKFDKIDYVGPQIGEELIRGGLLAVMLSFFSIMVYIAIRFEWHYGVGILIALIHDTILSMSFLSITGLEFNTTSIAAILTIIGYSVNDSVVIYDRIRENFRRHKSMTIEQIINLSINETLSRTTLTVVTTLIAVLALILYAGETLQSFSLTVFFGIIFGTYSSIFISAPLLITLGLKVKKV
jgi:preprotein translocase subunit SecF